MNDFKIFQLRLKSRKLASQGWLSGVLSTAARPRTLVGHKLQYRITWWNTKTQWFSFGSVCNYQPRDTKLILYDVVKGALKLVSTMRLEKRSTLYR